MATDWNEWFGHEHPPALQKEWVLRSTWTDCPVEIQEIIGRLWSMRDLGNDNYVYKTTIEDLEELQAESAEGEAEWEVWKDEDGWVNEPVQVGSLISYLQALGVQPKEAIMIHHWW